MSESYSRLEAKRYIDVWNRIDRELEQVGGKLKFIITEKDRVKKYKPVILDVKTLRTNKIIFRDIEFVFICKVNSDGYIEFTLKEIPHVVLKNPSDFSRFYKTLGVVKDVLMFCNSYSKSENFKVLEYREKDGI